MKVTHKIHRIFYPLYEQLWIERYRKLKKGDVYVDVGSYIGEFLPYTSKKVGKHGKVIAIEPIPHCQVPEIFQLNIRHSAYITNGGFMPNPMCGLW